MTAGTHVLVAVVLASLSVAACADHATPPFAPWELRGTVVELRDERLRVRHKSGQIVDLLVDDRTIIDGSEGRATVSALTHGRRVIVNVEPSAGGPRAARVRVFGGSSN